MPTVTLPLIWTLAVLFAILGLGSLVRLFGLRGAEGDERRNRLGSLATWWALLVATSLAAMFGIWGTAVFLLVASLLSLNEYNAHLKPQRIGRVAEFAQYSLAVLLFALGAAFGKHAIWLAAPIAVAVTIGAIRCLRGDPAAYAKITGGMVWAFVLFAYAPSLLLLLVIESKSTPPAGVAGWFVYAAILTELNDIFQALVGRKWGRTLITPKVSPKKSLEGLLGGIAASAVFGIALAPTLTSFFEGRSRLAGIGISALTGVILSLAGFLGDINVSSIKRDAGVKDIRQIVPGQGGALDRMNSFSYVAPVFYFWVVWVLRA
jgi:phosphatidate cytidylyltransferase